MDSGLNLIGPKKLQIIKVRYLFIFLKFDRTFVSHLLRLQSVFTIRQFSKFRGLCILVVNILSILIRVFNATVSGSYLGKVLAAACLTCSGSSLGVGDLKLVNEIIVFNLYFRFLPSKIVIYCIVFEEICLFFILV